MDEPSDRVFLSNGSSWSGHYSYGEVIFIIYIRQIFLIRSGLCCRDLQRLHILLQYKAEEESILRRKSKRRTQMTLNCCGSLGRCVLRSSSSCYLFLSLSLPGIIFMICNLEPANCGNIKLQMMLAIWDTMKNNLCYVRIYLFEKKYIEFSCIHFLHICR